MSILQPGTEELRALVRRALVSLLEEEGESATAAGRAELDEISPQRRTEPPPEREAALVVRGSERAVGLLEEALRVGEATLEIGIGVAWGPRVRVRAVQAGFRSAD